MGTVGWNAAGGATSNYIKGDDPLTGAISSSAGASLGYAGGKIIQRPLDKVINPNWKNWQWVDVGMGISKPLPLSPVPAVTGNIGGSAISESGGKAISQGIEDFKRKGDKRSEKNSELCRFFLYPVFSDHNHCMRNSDWPGWNSSVFLLSERRF
ncbi:hypothetical protein [Pantoea sp. FN0307]|uniref:hypothetical protein n=1 Tax=unclassified Pantoea TaxID=2630326 RepID=UPI003CE7EEBB